MKQLIAVVSLSAFVLGIALQTWLESQHKVDSLGLWYTILCALLYAIPIAALLTGALVLIRRVRA